MRLDHIRQKLRAFGAFFLILLLLPYVVTIFAHGADMDAAGKDLDVYVKVKETGDDGKEKIISLPWEEYFIGVLAQEIPVQCEEEFLKAQAVVIRTKLYQTLDSGGDKVLEEHYLKMGEMETKLGGADYEEYHARLRKAIKDTGNQVLFYGDEYAYVPFHQSSNGSTRSGSEVLGEDSWPYLQVRECPLDREADDEMQVMMFEYREVQKKCQPFLVAVEEADAEKTLGFSDLEILSYDSAGYVSSFRIGDTICTGDQVREALALPSGAFSIKEVKGKLAVTTIGKGHGLGMSQWTANEMAKEGKTYQEILQYFYEGTVLKSGGEIFLKVE